MDAVVRAGAAVVGAAALAAAVVVPVSLTASSAPRAVAGAAAHSDDQAFARAVDVPPVAVRPEIASAHVRVAARVHAVPARKHVAVSHFVAGPTSWSALNAAIARIPAYHPGWARWVVQNTGWWATDDWYHSVIYMSPTTPADRLYDVVVHEWSHIVQIRDYGGDVPTAVAALGRYFGGPSTTGAERAADCMAIVQGADWTHYTPCTSARWLAGARRLLAGERV